MKITTQFFKLTTIKAPRPDHWNAYEIPLKKSLKSELGDSVQVCASVLIDGEKYLLILLIINEQIVELKFNTAEIIAKSEQYLLSNSPTKYKPFDWFCLKLEKMGFRIENSYSELNLEELTMLQETGKVLHVIRSVKNRTGMGLQDAKDLVDRVLFRCKNAKKDKFRVVRNPFLMNGKKHLIYD